MICDAPWCETPGALASKIAQIAYRLARELPPGSLSDGEMTLFLNPVGAKEDGSFIPAHRRSLMDIRALLLTNIGQRSYLDLHCVSQVTRLAGHHLLQHAKSGSLAAKGYEQISVENIVILLAAVYEILARGYSEGIRIVMGHHVPEIYGAKRNRPHLSEPWILVKRKAGTIAAIETYWARLPHIPD